MPTIDAYEVELRKQLTNDGFYRDLRLASDPLSERDQATLRRIAGNTDFGYSAAFGQRHASQQKLEQDHLVCIRAAILLSVKSDPEGIEILIDWLTTRPDHTKNFQPLIESALMDCLQPGMPSQVPAPVLQRLFVSLLVWETTDDITEGQADVLLSALHFLAASKIGTQQAVLSLVTSLPARSPNRSLVIETAAALSRDRNVNNPPVSDSQYV